MDKKFNKFKEDFLEFIKILPTEFVLSIFLGAFPIWLYSKNQDSLDEMVSGLLAIGQLIDYFGWMLIPYAVVLLIKGLFRFRSDQGKYTFNFLHKILSEVGTGFQTILRTGAGVAIGILALPEEVIRPTPAQHAMLCLMVFITIMSSSLITLFKEEVIRRTERQPYKNDLKLNVK